MENANLTKLITEAATILGREQVDPDAALMELGVDSMNIVELIMLCEQIYGSNVDPDSLELDEYTTMRELDERLSSVAV